MRLTGKEWLLVGLVYMAGMAQSHGQQVLDQSEAALPHDLLAAAVNAFGEVLYDPRSAQLRKLSTFTPVGADYEALCGEVNAKNQLGGYVGFEPFSYLPVYDQVILGARCR